MAVSRCWHIGDCFVSLWRFCWIQSQTIWYLLSVWGIWNQRHWVYSTDYLWGSTFWLHILRWRLTRLLNSLIFLSLCLVRFCWGWKGLRLMFQCSIKYLPCSDIWCYPTAKVAELFNNVIIIIILVIINRDGIWEWLESLRLWTFVFSQLIINLRGCVSSSIISNARWNTSMIFARIATWEA